MRIIHLLAAGAATLAVAVPAAAQQPYAYPYAQPTYPQYQYPQGYAQPGYAYPGQQGYGGQNVVGQIINQLLGNRYTVTDRTAVTHCATAAMTQASAQYRPRGYGYGQNYRQGYGYPGYNHAYNPAMRVTAVTDVRRQSRGLRVSGLMSSGMHAGYAPYGHAYGYRNQAQAQGDLTFRCNVAYNGQVTNVRIGRNNQYRRY